MADIVIREINSSAINKILGRTNITIYVYRNDDEIVCFDDVHQEFFEQVMLRNIKVIYFNNINNYKEKDIVVGMKVREIHMNLNCEVFLVAPHPDGEVAVKTGNQVGVYKKKYFWENFEEVQNVEI